MYVKVIDHTEKKKNSHKHTRKKNRKKLLRRCPATSLNHHTLNSIKLIITSCTLQSANANVFSFVSKQWTNSYFQYIFRLSFFFFYGKFSNKKKNVVNKLNHHSLEANSEHKFIFHSLFFLLSLLFWFFLHNSNKKTEKKKQKIIGPLTKLLNFR